MSEQEILRKWDESKDPFCERAELVVWSVGCAIGMLIGVLLVVSGFFNGGEDIADATVRVVFGLVVVGFCGVLARCKYTELWKKFGGAENGEIFLQRLDPELIEAEWRRHRKLLKKTSAQKGGDYAD